MGTCRRHGTPEPRSSRPYLFHVPTAIPVRQVYRPRSHGPAAKPSSSLLVAGKARPMGSIVGAPVKCVCFGVLLWRVEVQ